MQELFSVAYAPEAPPAGRVMRVSLPLVLSCALAASCAPVRYVLPGAGPDEDAFNDALCTQGAILSVEPPNLPRVHRHLTTGGALGVLLVAVFERAEVDAERGWARDECLIALGYREVR